jgi:hypothetical protein
VTAKLLSIVEEDLVPDLEFLSSYFTSLHSLILHREERMIDPANDTSPSCYIIINDWL